MKNTNAPEPMTDSLRRQVMEAYRRASNRVIFLDYDGTLVPFTDEPRGASPGPALLDALQTLTGESANHVVIISGRDKETLYEWLGHLDLEFICEHGAWRKETGKPWLSPLSGDNAWKNPVRDLFERYAQSVSGTVIEEKDFSLVWHYRKAPQVAGSPLFAGLVEQLAQAVRGQPVDIFENDLALEAKDARTNKGTTARLWVQRYQPDFILAIGDDRTDEDTFRAMPASAFTIKVRPGASGARYCLPTHEDVIRLLASMQAENAPLPNGLHGPDQGA